jgi:hypothetical protein
LSDVIEAFLRRFGIAEIRSPPFVITASTLQVPEDQALAFFVPTISVFMRKPWYKTPKTNSIWAYIATDSALRQIPCRRYRNTSGCRLTFLAFPDGFGHAAIRDGTTGGPSARVIGV